MPAAPRSLACLLLPLAMAGCGGEVSWKRGAREQDWASDRALCAERKDFIDCMAARGWSVKDLGDGREASGSQATAVFFDPDAAMAGPTPAGAATAKEPSSAAASSRPVTRAPSPDGIPQAMPSPQTLARIGESASPSGSGTDSRPPAPPAEPRDPLDRVEVNSWWKLGGRAGEVDTATEDCVKKLGPQHAPEGPHYTLGTLSCLKEKGWRALTVKRSE